MPLTREEKKALAKQKKLEKKRKAEERKQNLLRQHLDREIKYGMVTLKKHEKEWKHLTADLALREKEGELHLMWVQFEKIIDLKGFTMSFLLDELDACNDHHLLSLKNHYERMDKLIAGFYEAMKELNEENAEKLMVLKEENELRCASLNQHVEEEENVFKTNIHTMSSNQVKYDREFMTLLFCEMDDVRDRHVIDRRHLLAHLENKMAIVWRKTAKIFEKSKSRIVQRVESCEKLKDVDCQNADLIEKGYNRYQQLAKKIKTLKGQYAEIDMYDTGAINTLQMEAKFFDRCMFQLKNKLLADRNHDHRKRRLLTIEWNKMINYLKHYERRGELLLKMISINRKYETLREKVLPFYSNAKNAVPMLKSHYHKLNLFYQKIAMVESSRLSLLEEKRELKNNIAKLREQIDYIKYYQEKPSSITKEEERQSLDAILSSKYKLIKRVTQSEDFSGRTSKISTASSRKAEPKRLSNDIFPSDILPGIRM